MKEFSFNINHIIKVKLTDSGKDILNKHFLKSLSIVNALNSIILQPSTQKNMPKMIKDIFVFSYGIL